MSKNRPFRAISGLIVILTLLLGLGSLPLSVHAEESGPQIVQTATTDTSSTGTDSTTTTTALDSTTATVTETTTTVPETTPTVPGADTAEPTVPAESSTMTQALATPSLFACVDIDPTFRQLAITGHPVSGHYTVSDGFRTVQFFVQDASSGGKVVNWQSDGPIDAVILRSGQDAATYEYEPPARSDTGLLPPLNDREGRNLAAILACYDPADAVVGIELFLADSEDPVYVGSQFDYVVSIDTNAPITDAELTITLPSQVTAVSAPDCVIYGTSVRCAPPIDDEAFWETTITVSAETGGNAVASAKLQGRAGDQTLELSATEVTRIIAPPGHDGGCGEDEEECGDGGASLVDACLAIAPNASAALLPGPFANRRYLVEGAGEARIWVTISEATGQQAASWESNIPVDAVLARTGRAIADYRYDFPTFSGGGIVGPPGGSGQPRPMADLAFCYVVHPAVDVTLSNASLPRMTVGGSGVVQVTVTNHGYVDAEDITIDTSMTENVALRSCVGMPPDGSRCLIGALAAGSTRDLQIELAGISVGAARITLDVQAANETADARANNSMELSFIVEAVGDQPSTGRPTDEVVVGLLPLTGSPIDTMALGLAWLVLITTGAALLIWTRRRDWPDQDTPD